MGTVRQRIKHAFAVDPPGSATPTPEQQPAVDWVCKQVARRHLTMPGLIALEMSRPLNFMAAQTMHFFAPAVSALARHQTRDHYNHFAQFLEQRGSFLYLAERVEHFEEEFERREKAATAPSPDESADSREGP
ncbi:MAG: hypothetical protein HKO59_01990 [Phycisphaerales bacterium]|nr:hypothetical protein [Phycisphaerae bacterium]NNF44035.1 hypothetical protein [Phycisphaerales bacterium]NNM24752.1 hypothetical protein [Phycisphaerales bacterium]